MVSGYLVSEVAKEAGETEAVIRYRCMRLGLKKQGGIYLMTEDQKAAVMAFAAGRKRRDK